MLDRPVHRFRRRGLIAGLAAAASLVLAVTVLWLLLPGPSTDTAIAERIAREVFTNHIRIKSLDLETTSLADIRSHFDRLDFVPLQSRLLESEPVRLKGGRYCTLQGVLATQLVYTTNLDDTLTHYQATYKPEVFGPIPNLNSGETPIILHERGLEIRIWVEGGVLMATGRPQG